MAERRLLLRLGSIAARCHERPQQAYRPLQQVEQYRRHSVYTTAHQRRIVRPQNAKLPAQHQNPSILHPNNHLRTSYPNRPFSSTPRSQHGDLTPPKPGEERHITFIDKNGTSYTFEVSDGDNLLDIAQANDLEMEGACGGSCACSTCHVIVQDEEMYDRMEEPSDDENDMLDLAFGLTETSRLGCQVVMSKELDGLVVKLPSMTRNMQASDFADKQ